MFHSYRKFNQSSKKGLYLIILIFAIVVTIGIISYTGIEVKPKLIEKEISIVNK